jgi:hypothetical protein
MRPDQHLRAAIRPRRYLRIAALFAALAALVGGCSDENGTPDRLTGVITEVRLDSKNEVESIRLRDTDNRMWDLPVEFDPGNEVPGFHLEEHRAQRLPVVVRVRESANGIYASEINDVDPH